MPCRSGPRLPLGWLNSTTQYTDDRGEETDVSGTKAVLRATPAETTPTCAHSRTTSKFIEKISVLVSRSFTEVQDARRGSRKSRQGLNPFAREFLLSAPITTIKLLAQLCVASPPPPLARNKKKLHFLDLPPEARLQIYDDCYRARWKKYRKTQEIAARPDYIPPIFSTNQMWDTFVADATEPFEPAILRVSKLVREEGLAEYVKFLEREIEILGSEERELKRKVREERKLLGNLAQGQSLYMVAKTVKSYPEKVAVCQTREMMGREVRRLERMGWVKK
ncbi:hypothetical protein CERZMDRAFT_99721 [Cercospora zeae-maydis SCOH1-5]|uniref:Uncharacterized protein n=1 Tax=Cercospora zeae-maydis SCOH1-5 TaxID=717836 RepID=A0A6A6F9F3_9PEZI|nr:hypothetical protein CERZMDRAFT_99721 [Cercospora zeae-maydis SCOH1-5]